MWVYPVLILVILFLMHRLSLFPEGEMRKKKEVAFTIAIGAVLVVLAGLRGDGVGADTPQYRLDYEFIRMVPLINVMDRYEVSTFYFVLSKIFSYTRLSYHWWFALSELVYVVAITLFFKKFSNDRLFSILGFVTIGLFTFSLAGIKQTWAMAMSAFAFISLSDRKYAGFVIFMTLAYFFHNSSLVFLFGIALYALRKSKYFYLVLIVFGIFTFFWGETFWGYLLFALGSDHYDMYLEADNLYSSATFIFYVILFLISVMSARTYSRAAKEESRVLCGMAFLVVAFQSLATTYSTAFRLAYYFLPFFIVLLSNNFTHLRADSKWRLMKYGILLILLVWFFWTGRSTPYEFFWQTV